MVTSSLAMCQLAHVNALALCAFEGILLTHALHRFLSNLCAYVGAACAL